MEIFGNILMLVFCVLIVTTWIKLYQYVKIHRKHRDYVRQLEELNYKIKMATDYKQIVELINEYNKIKEQLNEQD